MVNAFSNVWKLRQAYPIVVGVERVKTVVVPGVTDLLCLCEFVSYK